MKKPYQIEAQRAVKQFEAMAADGNPAVQMMLPVAEMVGWLQKGVGELVRQAGLQLMDLLMQEEVRGLVGERSQRQAERTTNRWGSERGYCVVMGQKVSVNRPRVRTTDNQEVRLGSYEMFHRGEPLTETVWESQPDEVERNDGTYSSIAARHPSLQRPVLVSGRAVSRYRHPCPQPERPAASGGASARAS